MHAVTFVLPDELANVSIAGLQWFILIPRLKHTGCHRPIYSHSILYLHREKNMIWNKNYPACCNPTNYEESSHWSLILVASYDMPQRKAELLYSKKKTGTPRGFSKFKEYPNDETVTKQKPFQRVEMENIKNFIRSFTELKKKRQSYCFSSKPKYLSNYRNVGKVI